MKAFPPNVWSGSFRYVRMFINKAWLVQNLRTSGPEPLWHCESRSHDRHLYPPSPYGWATARRHLWYDVYGSNDAASEALSIIVTIIWNISKVSCHNEAAPYATSVLSYSNQCCRRKRPQIWGTTTRDHKKLTEDCKSSLLASSRVETCLVY